MLLCLVVAIGFVACVFFWHLWQGITFSEAATLLIATAIVFSISLDFIYKEVTRDNCLISGNVTSMIHHTAFSYRCGKSTCHEPERWIIEQKSHKPQSIVNIARRINHGCLEQCYGECNISYPAPYSKINSAESDPILVDSSKFKRTKLADPSAVWKEYFNPVQVSDEVIYNSAANKIPYFTLDDYNFAHRLIAANITKAQEEKLEQINAELQNKISVGLIVTTDNLYFEKLRHAWHQGKANDFVVVVNSPDGKTVRNVNVLGWDNYKLKEKVSTAIMAIHIADIDMMLTAINDNLKGQAFIPADFSRYHFVNVKIPNEYYWKIFIFNTLFFSYMLWLLHLNPNTKDNKLKFSEVIKMWDKHFKPPHSNWYLHPFTPTGLLLHIGVPLIAAAIIF